MKNEILLKNWFNADLKQLENFYNKNKNCIIYINKIQYKINSYFMNKNNVPTLEIINIKNKNIEHIYLSLVDENYINYSTLNLEQKTKFLLSLNC